MSIVGDYRFRLMISYEKDFIFIHIPRTGGTSLESALGDMGCVKQGADNFKSIFFKHAKASFIKTIMGAKFENLFKFSIIRNPWDWAVSNYMFNRGLHRPFVAGTKYMVCSTVPSWAQSWTFKHWLAWWVETFQPSQSSMITGKDGKILVDHIIRFENLNQGFERLCQRLEIPFRKLPHRKKTNRNHYRQYYDSQTTNFIEQHFSEDIERFGYA